MVGAFGRSKYCRRRGVGARALQVATAAIHGVFNHAEYVRGALARRHGRRVVLFTAHDFQQHVNETYGDKLAKLKYSGSAAKRENPRGISLSTAVRWLHVLGYCTDKSVRGAVFNDGAWRGGRPAQLSK